MFLPKPLCNFIAHLDSTCPSSLEADGFRVFEQADGFRVGIFESTYVLYERQKFMGRSG